ncbi:MAG: hypothetical protein OES13_12170 [Acidimicrobiia bacterium]|nr:hypothetical protein [Acidimicrobiia bacterium]
MKTLIVYYSRTGLTKKVAEATAADLAADIVRIEDSADRTGALGYLRAGLDALLGRSGSIRPAETDPADYDLVILGSPVWAGRLSTPVRTYIAENKTALKHVAFFCTEGAAGAARVFKEMQELSGRHPVATLEVTGANLKSGDHVGKVGTFTRHITDLINSPTDALD